MSESYFEIKKIENKNVHSLLHILYFENQAARQKKVANEIGLKQAQENKLQLRRCMHIRVSHFALNSSNTSVPKI